MKASTIEGYTNKKAVYNTTSWVAGALARRISKWSIYNILYGFRPPKIGAVLVISPDLPPPEEVLEADLFRPGQLLHDRPLNFYIAVNALPEPYLLNAGYLQTYFAFGERIGYKELKRLLSKDVPAYGEDVNVSTPTIL